MTAQVSPAVIGQDSDDQRVLITAPTQRDAALAYEALRQAGQAARICPTIEQLCAEAPRGAAAVLLTDDVLESANPGHLTGIVEQQPEWSDLPFVVLARPGMPSPAVSWLQARTSVTLLERTVQLRTLISAVQAAVRARGRQYQVRALLDAERQARAEADRANTAKDRFLAVLSHELRTPLTPIVFAVATLQQKIGADSDLQRPLEMIRRNVALETKLIDDLLDLSRVVQGKLQLQKRMVGLHDRVNDTLAMIDSDARAKGIAVRLSLAAKACETMADPARIQQVLWNLTKNAIKFTHSGGTVTISTWNEGDAFCLSCADNGIGIAGDVVPFIFEPFQQGSTDITRQYGGLGLGLAVSRSLIEAHGGSLTARSDGPGEGATFTLRLPRVVARVFPDTSLQPENEGHLPTRGLRILLVEDHQDTADALIEALTSRGHDVQIAHSVADALRTAAAAHVELLISDIGLPDGSGLDLMRQISPRPSVGAVALSGFGMDDDLKRSRRAGFAKHLTKPVDIRRLEAAIAELMPAPKDERR